MKPWAKGLPALLAAAVLLAGCAGASSSAAAGDATASPVTAKHYELEGRTIDFEDLPGTEAETLVANHFLQQTYGNFTAQQALWVAGSPSGPTDVVVENEAKQYEEGGGTQWVRIDDMAELSAGDLAGAGREQGILLFSAAHQNEAPGMPYEDYVQALYDGGVRVVRLQYEDRYTELTRQSMPQIEDGAHDIYFVALPTAEGLRLYADTRFYLPLAGSYLNADGDAPAVRPAPSETSQSAATP